MLWLNKCLIPSPLKEVITINVVYLSILLAYGRPLELLPAMVCYHKSGLHELSLEFCKVTKTVDNQREEKVKTPNPRVEILYT